MFDLLIRFFTCPGWGLISEPRKSSLEVLAIPTDSPTIVHYFLDYLQALTEREEVEMIRPPLV
ncbi:hypothetical protein I79_023497 [Cricetulus griseus]|uniref:Uncharacterized protein n=1 Tax=Cricetulus griseus TaxID=10029 RepID=G3II36_CRIGR|nr:hypothetical protein I79_023497 [Cricetulus griseus]